MSDDRRLPLAAGGGEGDGNAVEQKTPRGRPVTPAPGGAA